MPNSSVLGKLSCYSNLTILDSSNVYFDISPVQSVYDCDGKRIDYVPRITIDPISGSVVANQKLSRELFCDATFSITVRKDDFYKTSNIIFLLKLS